MNNIYFYLIRFLKMTSKVRTIYIQHNFSSLKLIVTSLEQTTFHFDRSRRKGIKKICQYKSKSIINFREEFAPPWHRCFKWNLVPFRQASSGGVSFEITLKWPTQPPYRLVECNNFKHLYSLLVSWPRPNFHLIRSRNFLFNVSEIFDYHSNHYWVKQSHLPWLKRKRRLPFHNQADASILPNGFRDLSPLNVWSSL